jgi:hypothetical protein
VIEQNQVALHERFSPAELCLALCDSLLEAEERGELPEAVARTAVLGPLEAPALTPTTPAVSRATFAQALRGFVQESRTNGYLAHDLTSFGVPAGLGSFYRALCDLYLAAFEGKAVERVALQTFNRYPQVARELGHHYLDITEASPDEPVSPASLLDPELETGSICRLGRLQTWTIKPAEVR